MIRQFIMLIIVSIALSSQTAKKYYFSQLQKMLDNVDQDFLKEFLKYDFKSIPRESLGEYVCLYGKAQLYGMLQSPASILKGFAFIKIAAQRFQVRECMHIMGVMYNFKMTPHFNLEQSILNNSILNQYITRSHLKNSQMFWYLSSLKQYMPSTMILGNLNHVGLSTKVNCTTAAMYYRMIIEKVFVQEYQKHSYYRDKSNIFEQELYLKQKIQFSDEADESYMIEETLNLGQQSFLSNFNIAQNYYYGRNGFLRNSTKAAEMFEKLKQIGNSQSSSLLGMCYFKGEGVPKNYQKAYQLFKASKSLDLSKYMINLMEYFGIYAKKNRQAVLKRLKSQSKDNYHSKGLYGALILKGQVPDEQKMTGMVLLQQSSNYGFSISKLILGLTFLDGIDIAYSCPKGITLIREGLMNVDLWADKAEQAKRAIKQSKYIFALIKYFQLALTGSSVGLVNGLYLLEMYLPELRLDSWDHEVVANHPLFIYLQSNLLNLDAQQLLFGDIYQLIPKEQARPVLMNNTKNYINYAKTKILTICKNGGVSICMFLSYKQNPSNKGLLKNLAKREGQKLHLLEARFLLGQHYQKLNETQLAISQYTRATSSIIAPLILLIEGYELNLRIIDDLVLVVTVIAVTIACAVIHRNMILIKKHKQEQEKQEREEKKRYEQEQEEIARRTQNINIQKQVQKKQFKQKYDEQSQQFLIENGNKQKLQ